MVALPLSATLSRATFASRLAGMVKCLARMAKCLARADRRYRQRRVLAELDDRLLADIGVSRGEAERECRKPLWR
jgi:uncharacterized protein YjiS (DUF1127 family)